MHLQWSCTENNFQEWKSETLSNQRRMGPVRPFKMYHGFLNKKEQQITTCTYDIQFSLLLFI